MLNKKEIKKLAETLPLKRKIEEKSRYFIDYKEKKGYKIFAVYQWFMSKSYEIKFIHFFKNNEWINYRNGKWLTSRIDNIREFSDLLFWGWDKTTIPWQYKRIYNFQNNDFIKATITKIEETEKEIQNKILQNKYKEEIQIFEERNKVVPKTLPKSFEKAVWTKFSPGYAICDTKLHIATCSLCNHEFSYPKSDWNKKLICPKCHKDLTTKSNKRFSVYDNFYATLVQKTNNQEIVIRDFLCSQSLSSKSQTKKAIQEVQRTFLNTITGDTEIFIYEQYKQSDFLTFLPIKYWRNPISYYSNPHYNVHNTNLWKQNFNRIKVENFKGKYVLKNLEALKQQKGFNATDDTFNYILELITTYPFTETWINQKKNIKLITENKNIIKKHVSETSKALQIPKNCIEKIAYENNTKLIPNLQFLFKNHIHINDDVINFLKEEEKLLEEIQNSINELFPVSQDQSILMKSWKYIYKNKLDIGIYLSLIKKIKEKRQWLNLKEIKKLMFPDKFYQTYQNLLNSDPQEQEYNLIKKASPYISQEINDIIFRLPETLDEIDFEGELQHNCVKQYKNNVLNQSTNIIFGRKKENPYKPYMTIEIKNNKIVQAKYAYNNNVSAEDYATIKEYINTISQFKTAA